MARRMSNGDGTRPRYDEKKKLWRVDFTIDETGTRRSLYGKTETEVKEKRDQLKEDLKNGCLVLTNIEKLTFGEWLDEWLDVYKKGKVSDNTYSAYSSVIRVNINDKLKKVKLKQIRHDMLQRLINESSSGTCGNIRKVLSQSFSVAVKNKYILYSPAIGLNVPTKKKKEVIPLTDEEVTILLADRKGTRNYLYYVLSVYTGARIGEVLGLSWKDIDLENNVIHIRNSLKQNKESRVYSIGETKTGKSRDVPILPKVIAAIKQHKANQSAEKLKIGKEFNSNNMVFCDAVGGYLKNSKMYYELVKTIKAMEIKTKVTPHTLRHTFVSQMISAGSASIALISKIVGHTDITTTLNIYGHLMPNDMNEAFNALAKRMENIAI